MNKEIKDLLLCPSCYGQLNWEIINETDRRIVTADIKCDVCSASYEVKDEIAMFLTPDLVRNDLWVEADSTILKFFNENKNLLSDLEEIEPHNMNGADLWFLASYHEMKGNDEKSKSLFEIAFPKVYSQNYLSAWDENMDYIVENIVDGETVVDIASGKGYLVKKILEERSNMVIATDFSPTILLRNKGYYQELGLYENLSLLAFDARRTPFKKDSVDLLTTNVGLSNIQNAGNISKEIERISKDRFMFYLEFLDDSDKVHMDLLNTYEMSDLNTKKNCFGHFKERSFDLTINNSITLEKLPTPSGEILEGIGIDGIPVHPIEVECCVLEGKKVKV